MCEWIVSLKEPWRGADDPSMSATVKAKSRGSAMWLYVLMARDAGYLLKFTDCRAIAKEAT